MLVYIFSKKFDSRHFVDTKVAVVYHYNTVIQKLWKVDFLALSLGGTLVQELALTGDI